MKNNLKILLGVLFLIGWAAGAWAVNLENLTSSDDNVRLKAMQDLNGMTDEEKQKIMSDLLKNLQSLASQLGNNPGVEASGVGPEQLKAFMEMMQGGAGQQAPGEIKNNFEDPNKTQGSLSQDAPAEKKKPEFNHSEFKHSKFKHGLSSSD